MAITNISARVYKMEKGPPYQEDVVNTYTREDFATYNMFAYTPADAADDDWHPTEVSKAVYFYSIFDVATTRPSFIDATSWTQLRKGTSGFLSSNKTNMPKLLFPTLQICHNGLTDPRTPDNPQYLVLPSEYETAFNWICTSIQGESDPPMSAFGSCPPNGKYGLLNMGDARQAYDSSGVKTRTFSILEAEGPVGDYEEPLIGQDEGGAAFALTYAFIQNNLTPVTTDETSGSSLSVPKFTTTFNDIDISIGDMGDVAVEIGAMQTIGSLVKQDVSVVPGQYRSKLNSPSLLLVYPVWNGLVVSPGVGDSKNIVDSGLYCVYNNDISISDQCDPKLEDYPTDAPKDVVVQSPAKVVPDWGHTISIAWEKTVGQFSYTPAFFVPICAFSVFFRAKASDDINTYKYFAYPVYTTNNSGYYVDVLHNGEARAVGQPSDNGMQYYRYDFLVQATNEDIWKRRSPEVWGFIQRKQTTAIQQRVLNSNGDFSMDYGTGAVYLPYWFDYITNISISIGMDGITGNMTLDRYGMLGQVIQPVDAIQRIGGMRIEINGGNPDIMEPGVIFTGLGMEITDSISSSSDTFGVSLYGLERKLEDIKLINAPFWDGDKLSTVAAWIASYGGIDIVFPPMSNPNASLPRSSNFEAPAVNFQMGTTVLEALRKIALYTNHRFIIQKDGKGYFYEQNEYGIPKQCYSGGQVFEYDDTVAISYDSNPSFANLYNTFMTVGLLVQSDGGRQPLDETLLPGIKFDRVSTVPNLPWSKVFVSGEQGYLTLDKLTELHNNNIKIGRNVMQIGSVTVPGSSKFNIFDRIVVAGDQNYIYQIAHNIDLQTKTWSTTLSIGKTI